MSTGQEILWRGSTGVAVCNAGGLAYLIVSAGRYVHEVIEVDLYRSRHVAWIPLVVPTGFDVDPQSGALAITFAGLRGPLFGFGGLLMLSERARTANACLQIGLYVIRLVEAGVGAILSTLLRGFRAKTTRLLIADAERAMRERFASRSLPGCWHWPTAVRFVRSGDGTERIALATAAAIFSAPLSKRAQGFRVEIQGLVNCVHLYQDADDEKGAVQLLVSEGHLHVPDLLAEERGLGCVWSLNLSTGVIRARTTFLKVLGASVPLQLKEEKAVAAVISVKAQRRVVRVFDGLQAHDLDVENPRTLTVSGENFLVLTDAALLSLRCAKAH